MQIPPVQSTAKCSANLCKHSLPVSHRKKKIVTIFWSAWKMILVLTCSTWFPPTAIAWETLWQETDVPPPLFNTSHISPRLAHDTSSPPPARSRCRRRGQSAASTRLIDSEVPEAEGLSVHTEELYDTVCAWIKWLHIYFVFLIQNP